MEAQAIFKPIRKKRRRKTHKKKCSSPTPQKRNICGYPEIVDSRENPNILSLDETHDYEEKEILIRDFLNNPTTQLGDIVNYFPQNQLGRWTAIVQTNNHGNKCLGTSKTPNDDDSDSDNNGYQTDNNGYQTDNNGYQTDNSYLSDSYGGKKSKKHKSKKHKSKKHKSKKHKSKKHKSKKHKSKKHKSNK